MQENTSYDFYDTVARLYDAENAHLVDDLPFYGDLMAQTGGPVLDAGCGTGRVTFHLAQEGVRVVGVDLSTAMLARAERKLAVLPDLHGHVSLRHGDLLTVELAERFALIVVPYNTFMHFKTQAAQITALERMRGWLLPEGLIALDLPNPADLFASPDDGSLVLERTFEEPESGSLVMQQSASTLDRAAQIMYVTWIYDEVGADGTLRRTVAPLTLRYIFPAEMDLLLRVVGLERFERYGDYDGSPFEDGSPRMIVVARAQR